MDKGMDQKKFPGGMSSVDDLLKTVRECQPESFPTSLLHNIVLWEPR